MKRALVLAVGLLLAGGTAYAGDWHSGAQLQCQDCHTMHASLQHSYTGSTTGYPVTYTPTTYLLKGDGNQLCLSCHDEDSSYPDVMAVNNGYTFIADRSAGALNDVGGSPGGYLNWHGHTIGSTATAPGDTGSFVPDATDGLRCTDCHNPHGYNNGAVDTNGAAIASTYRNLVPQSFGGVSVSYTPGGTNPLTTDVYESFANEYDALEVNLNEPNTSDSGFAAWCGGCHVNFHGAVGDPDSVGGSGTPPTGFLRHPNSTVNIGEAGGGHSDLAVFSGILYRVRVMSATGDWGSRGSAWGTAPADLTPTCLSCHKGHGNQNAFGLIYALGDAELGEEGDGTGVRDLCKQCHVQGG